jgi:hypothetical protein
MAVLPTGLERHRDDLRDLGHLRDAREELVRADLLPGVHVLPDIEAVPPDRRDRPRPFRSGRRVASVIHCSPEENRQYSESSLADKQSSTAGDVCPIGMPKTTGWPDQQEVSSTYGHGILGPKPWDGQHDRIESGHPLPSRILGGTPVFVGTRVPAQTLFDYLEGGDTLDEFPPAVPIRQARAGDRSTRARTRHALGWCAFFLTSTCP